MSTRSRRTLIVVAVLVGGVVALNLLANGLDRAVGGNEPGGVTGSAYATGPDGLAAYASLLSHFGHEIAIQRGSFGDERISSTSTVVVIDPTVVTHDDASALLEFVTNGGRLVIGGKSPFYLRDLRDRPPKWSPEGTSPWTEIDPLVAGVRTIDTASAGSWSDPGSGDVVVGNAQHSLLTRDTVGRGEIWFLADTSPIQNAYLGEADNAAFALTLAGAPDRGVVFAEGLHGFGGTRGFAAIPTRWKVALLVLGLAVLAFVWSRARRFGPPDRAQRELPPARAEYVRALSITLERTHDPGGALTPLQQWARERLSAGAGLRPDATDEEIAAAARTRGFDDAEIAALLAPPATDEAALTLGRIAARVGEHDGRIT